MKTILPLEQEERAHVVLGLIRSYSQINDLIVLISNGGGLFR